MNQTNQQTFLLDIRDLFFVMLKRYYVFFIVGLFFGGVLGCYKLISEIRISSVSSDSNSVISVLDINSKLPKETDLEYSQRVLDINHAKDLINSIDVMEQQVDNQRRYVSNSILMQIDSENEAVSTATIIVSIENSQINNADLALVSTYKQFILSGEYLTELSENTGVNQGYLLELISAEYSTSTSVVLNTSGNSDNVGVVTVRVIGPSIDLTESILNAILNNVEIKYLDVNESIPHSISVAARQNSYIVDSNTRDRQFNASNRFETVQQQINNFDKALDNVASKIGVEKSLLFLYFSEEYNNDSTSGLFSISSVIKYFIVGVLFAFVLVFIIISFVYIFNKRFSTQSKFFCRFNDLKKIGVIKPQDKRSRFSKYIDVKTGDDNKMSNDINMSIIAANVNNLTCGMNKVLFTGTIDSCMVEKLVQDLKIQADVKAGFFDNSECLQALNDYDGVIIVEQRKISDCKLVSEELKLIANTHSKLVGAIIL